MKASDYIMEYLHRRGVTHIYEVIGGMITHLIDSAHRHGKIELVSVHHEQAAAFAADAMGRVTGVPGVALATSGPGAVNLLTGIGSCYFDSIPAVFITGQVNLHEQKGNRPIRQLGFQETDIVTMAQPITKAAWAVKSVMQIPALLDEAFHLALSERPGPVLLDIPMDIQRQDILDSFKDLNFGIKIKPFEDNIFLGELLSAVKRARKPLILAGGGIHSARSVDIFRQFVELLHIPVVNSLMAVDVLPYQHPLRVGLIGSYGNRWANIALGECDLLLVLGSRLDIRQTGADVKAFQEGRNIFHVDCESGEINNRIQGCKSAVTDLQTFFAAALAAFQDKKFVPVNDWLDRIQELRQLWPDINELKDVPGINPNVFLHRLSQVSKQASTYVVDVGNHQMWAAQSLDVDEHQYFMTSGGMGSMGFSLPAAIGACLATSRKPVVQVCGDGGMQMNIQELQTIIHHRLPIKMVILNNQSYGMVRQFQQSYFHERYASTYWGYSAPDFSRVAQAYGIETEKIENDTEVEFGLLKLWEKPSEPFLLQVNIDVMANAYPKIAFGYPLTQMEPFAKPLDMEGT